jgi:hypothetical protein
MKAAPQMGTSPTDSNAASMPSTSTLDNGLKGSK